MSNQQPLSGMEIKMLAQKIVAASLTSDMQLGTIVESILSQYIILPKHKSL